MTRDMNAEQPGFVRDSYIELSPAERVWQLSQDVAEARARLRDLNRQLVRGRETGRHLQAAQPEIVRLAREADRQRPYLLAVENGWEAVADADDVLADARRHHATVEARIGKARSDRRENAARLLDARLPDAGRAIETAEAQRAQAATDLYAASRSLFDQVGVGGLVTRVDVDKVRNDALDRDYLERNVARGRVEVIEGQLLRANTALEHECSGSGPIDGHPFAHTTGHSFDHHSGYDQEWER